MVNRIRSRWTLIGITLVLLLMILACGEEATPTEAPPAEQPAAAAQPAPAPTVAAVQTQPAATREAAPAATQAAPPATVAAVAATPAATPTPAPAPVESPTGPYGTLRVAVEDLGPPVFLLSQAGYATYRFLNLSTDEMLLSTSVDGRVMPRLAESWSVEQTPDGALYTFNIQQGVPFHDNHGDWGELTADDVLFSFRDATKEGTQHSGAAGVRRIWFCDECEITVVDDYTIQLNRPEARFDATWDIRHPFAAGVAIHSKTHFDTVGEDEAVTQSVATGPWRMEEFRSGDYFLMKGVRDHWRRPPDWDEFQWQLIKEDQTRIANFLTGQIDTGKFTAEAIQTIKQEEMPSTKYMTFPGVTWHYVPMYGQQYYTDHPAHQGEDPKVPIGENVGYQHTCNDLPWVACDRDVNSAEWEKARKVRLAMAIAIDRQKMVNNLAFGEGDPWYLSFWQGHSLRAKQFGLDELEHEYDPERARELLADAGYADGFEVEMTLTLRAFDSAQAACTMWQDIGVQCRIRNEEYSTYRPTQVRRTRVGLRSGNIAAQVEPLRLYPLFYSANYANNFGLEHPDLQVLIDEALALFEDEERWAKQAEIARWFFEQVVDIPLYAEADVWPLGPEIDAWEQMSPVNSWLQNWDSVPHRQ